MLTTVEPRFNEPVFNNVLGIIGTRCPVSVIVNYMEKNLDIIKHVYSN